MQSLLQRLLLGNAGGGGGGNPTLNYNFVDGSAFPSAITFSRGTNATQFDSSGNLVYAPVNLLTYSEDFGNAAWTKQASVSIATNTTVAPNGTTTGDTVTADSGFGVFQQLAVTVGTQVTQSVYLRAGTATSIMFRDDTGAGRHIVVNPSTGAITSTSGTLLNSGSVSVGNGWYRIFFSYTADSTLVRNNIRPDSAGAAQTFIVWGGQTSLFPTLGGVTADFATYYPTTTTAYYGPRLDYNPSTLAAQGLLIEEQRTNSIRNSTMQGAVAGTPGTLPTNWIVVAGGLGTLTQQVVGTGTSAGITYIDIRLSGTTSTTSVGYSFESTTQIVAAQNQVWASTFWAALQAGSLTNINTVENRIVERDAGGTSIGSTIIDFKASFTSVLTRTTTTRTLANASAARVTNDLTISFSSGVAIDITLRIGLPQLEQGAFATSVIPTTTTALTRSADVASVNTLSPWYNATEGTLFAEVTASANANAVYAALNNGTITQNSTYFDNDTGSIRAVTFASGTAVAALGLGAIGTAGTVNRLASAYKVNDFAAVRNGGTVQTDTSGAVPVSVSQLDLGRNPSGLAVTYISGYLRRITYYPVRLTDAALQQITT